MTDIIDLYALQYTERIAGFVEKRFGKERPMYDWLLQLLNTISQSVSDAWLFICNFISGIFFLIVVLLCVVFSPIIMLYISVSGSVERAQMRAEVFSYVQENKDTLPHEYTVYSESIKYETPAIYGFFYDNSGKYDYARGDDNLSFGSLIGANGERTEENNGWSYKEKICDDWFYYESHIGD